MSNNQLFNTNTALAKGLDEFFKKLEDRLSLGRPITAYLAGGMAVYLYASSRVTTDVDVEFGARVLLPRDLLVDVVLENGTTQTLYLDTNYNSTFALMHEDYLNDSIPIALSTNKIQVRVLSPVDLAVSKISRFADHDKEDIVALVRHGLVTADEIEKRALDALPEYVGREETVRLNLRDAIAIARQNEQKDSNGQSVHHP